ncbi:hypothetical protein [Fodinicola feengrottensis]|uniref:Uncharacterized protein n=1 Tax=Fodinicola feengrottensis TaxID=435914 RepID=A0ABN2JB46_9ACTN|nr:hypothetical protein [Fodinicola feengrottensis]
MSIRRIDLPELDGEDTGHVHHLAHLYVDDVGGHFAGAKAAGATAIAEP